MSSDWGDKAEEIAKTILTKECERRGTVPIWSTATRDEIASLIRAYGDHRFEEGANFLHATMEQVAKLGGSGLVRDLSDKDKK